MFTKASSYIKDIIESINKKASHPDAYDDNKIKLINYSEPEQGVFNGKNIDLGNHMLVFMENNLDVISTLNEIGYVLLRWGNLPCYASSGTTIGTINLPYFSDRINTSIFSYSSSDTPFQFSFWTL